MVRFYSIVFCFITFTAKCQTNAPVLTFAEQMPRYGESPTDFTDYLNTHIQYPIDAMLQMVEGKLMATCIINEQGKIIDIMLRNSVYPSIDAEAIRVLRAMPNWNPGKQNGRPVSVAITIPIDFNLKVEPIIPEYKWVSRSTVESEMYPSFPGGNQELKRFVYQKKSYPAAAKAAGKNETVNVGFTVKKDGSIVNIKAQHYDEWGFAEETERLVKAMPKWLPGKLNNRYTDCNVTLKIVFKLNTP